MKNQKFLTMKNMKLNIRQVCILIIVAFVMGQVWLVVPNVHQIILYGKKSVLDSSHRLLFLPQVISAILMANVIGHIDYYFGTKRGLLISLILATVGMFFVAVSDGGYAYFIVAQFCIGAAIAGTMSALSILSTFLAKKISASLLLILFAALILGGMTIPSLLDYFLHHHTWQEIPLYIGFITILLYMIVQLFVEDYRSEEHPKPKTHIRVIWKKIPWRLLFFLALILSNAISQILLQQLGGDYLTEIKKVEEKTIILLMTTFFLSMGIGAIISAIIDIFTPTRILYPALASCVVLGYILLPFSTREYQMFIGTILIGIGVWSLIPFTIFYIHTYLPETEEIATSLLISTYFLGIAIGKIFHNIHHEALRITVHLGLLTAVITLVISLFTIWKYSPHKK